MGSHIAVVFAERCIDDFKIRIALRDLSKKTHEKFKEILGEEVYNQIEFVQAELSDKEAINRAVKGVKYIVHSAGYSQADPITKPE